MTKLIVAYVITFSLSLTGCTNSKTHESMKNLEKNQTTQTDYKIALIAKPISNHQVEFNTKTNIPLPVEIMASIDLKNQKPEDSYIGYSKRVLLKKPDQIFVLDATNENLPTGKYTVEVAYCSNCPRQAYPKEKLSAADLITRLRTQPKTLKWIRKSSEIFLRGTGKSVKDAQERDKMQLWVMDNVFIGTSWNQKLFIEKLGNYQELKLDKDPGINPHIIKPCYFPKADMTIFVNTYRNEVTIWRMGKVSKL